MAGKNQVAKKEEVGGAVALWEEDGAPTGFEGTSQEDYALPFLKLLQKMSPEVDEDSGSYVQGAKPGLFYDTATGELFDAVDVIPCYYRRSIVEWAGDEPGSGFVAQHDPGYEKNFDRQVKNGKETGKWVTPEGHVLQDTRYFFCLRLSENEDPAPVVVSMTSTQIKKAKSWVTRTQNLKTTGSKGQRIQVPMYGAIWRLSAVSEENDLGTFKGYKIDPVGVIQDRDLAMAAKDAHLSFSEAASNVKPPEDTTGSDTKKDDDEIPF